MLVNKNASRLMALEKNRHFLGRHDIPFKLYSLCFANSNFALIITALFS